MMTTRLERWIPLVEQLRGSTPAALRGDVVAGLTTAVMLVPQAMAYAMLAGLAPTVGLYAAALPLAIYSLLGTSRQLAVGPVAMVSLLVASGVGPLAGDDPATFAALAALLMLMVGLIQWGMGVARLGFLVKFLSHPVIAGFTSAAALIIGASQLKHILGVSIPRSHHVHTIALGAIERLGEANPATVILSLASVAALVALKRRAPRFPRFLLVVAAGALAVWALGLDARGVAIVGAVPAGLPGFQAPTLSLDAITGLLPIAITIALVGFMQSISVAQAFARANHYSLRPDKELRALGLANVAGAFFQGYPVTGGFSRTAVNAQAGARSGLAGLVTAGGVALTLLFLTPLFYYLPRSVLAAIIMTAVAGLIDVREARHLWRVNRPDLALMGLTFVATLTIGIEPGILVGVAASLLWFIWKTSTPHVAVLGRLPGGTVYRNVHRYPEAQQTPGTLALRIDAPLFFANTGFLKQILAAREAEMDAPLAHLVLSAEAIGSVDAQAIDVLQEIIDAYREREVTVWFAGVRGPVRDAFARAGLTARVGPEYFVERVHEAIDTMDPSLRDTL